MMTFIKKLPENLNIHKMFTTKLRGLQDLVKTASHQPAIYIRGANLKVLWTVRSVCDTWATFAPMLAGGHWWAAVSAAVYSHNLTRMKTYLSSRVFPFFLKQLFKKCFQEIFEEFLITKEKVAGFYRVPRTLDWPNYMRVNLLVLINTSLDAASDLRQAFLLPKFR